MKRNLSISNETIVSAKKIIDEDSFFITYWENQINSYNNIVLTRNELYDLFGVTLQ